MQITNVGENAGKIWNYLASNPKASERALAKKLNLNRSDVASALGWLAREGKLVPQQTNHVFPANNRTYALYSVVN